MFKLLDLLAVVSLSLVNYSAVFSIFFLPHGGQITVIAQCYPEVIVVASDGVDGDFFGRSVTIDGNNALMGAYGDDDLGLESGSAYIFSEVSPGTWLQVAKLVASDGAESDQFGYAVAIDATNALIGANNDDDMGDNSGAAYVFSEVSAGTWVQVAKLVASDGAARDYFGWSVAISGNNALIGAYRSDDPGLDSGSAYIFSEVSPGTWLQVAKLVASDGAYGDRFGWSVAISGNNALIGAPIDEDLGDDSGSAYIFSEISAGTWVQVAKLVASVGAAFDYFGRSVAIDGNNALMGAYGGDGLVSDSGSAHIFSEVSPGTWVEVAKLVASDEAANNRFGQALAIDGTNALVAADGDDDLGLKSGSAYVFSEVSPGNWVQVDKFTASDGAAYDYLGNAVSISGTRVLVGSYYAEAAYFYYLDDVDGCPGNACEHGSTCMDAVYDYCCVCPPAYGGEFCTDCLCENGGVCQDDALGIGYCDCSDLHYSGNTCSKFCNNGVSETYPDTGCNCTLSGATGGTCNKDIDDCRSSPCVNGGTCTDYGADLFPNHAHEFNCTCDGTGYTGDLCQTSYCASSPCLNSGTCDLTPKLDGSLYAACDCNNTGYEGDFCQTEIDECASSPCLNDGVCTDLLGDFTCDCTGTGYDGQTCAMDVDDCLSSPCDNDGVCQDKGTNKFKCTCDEFWEGNVCADNVDDCILKGYYCENDAACTDDPVNMGDVLCDCSMSGFKGKYCNIALNDNECDSYNPCQNGGYCLSDDESLSCDCAGTGYTGDVCDIFSFNSDCVSSPCLHEGRCFDDETSDYTCDCTGTGYHGVNCEMEYCADVTCENGGTCMEDICTCTSDFTGEYCEIADDGFVTNNRSSSSSSSFMNVLVNDTVSYEVRLECGSTSKQEIVMIGMAGVSGMAILNWLVLREFPFFKNGINESPSTSQRLFFMMMFVFTLFDFITDVGFVDYVTNACESDLDDVDVFASVAGTVLGLSSAANMLVLLFLTSRDETKSFQKHLSKHTVITCFAMLVACANLSAILLLDSNLLGLKALTGGFPGALKNKIKLYAMGTGLLQNLPQLITQGTFMLKGGPSNAVTIPSVSFSGILLLITIVRVLMIACDMLNTKKKEYKLPNFKINS